MNLTSDPWLPVRYHDGSRAEVGLERAFVEGDVIADLDTSPLERIALLRLLIAVAHDILDGPNSPSERRRAAPSLKLQAPAYFQRWRHAFELLSSDRRFLQTKVERSPNADAGLIEKMDPRLAAGNASVLFDNAGGTRRQFSGGAAARLLIVLQNFAPPGLCSQVVWNGRETAKSAKAAPAKASNSLHAFVLGDCLLATLAANLPTRNEVQEQLGIPWGKPIWHVDPATLDPTNASQWTHSYLGRLVPLSRVLWLDDDLIHATFGEGLVYPDYYTSSVREPSVALRVVTRDQKEAVAVLPGRVEQSPWRELAALVGRSNAQGRKPPLAITMIADEAAHRLWVGAYITSQASPIELIEGTLTISTRLAEEEANTTYDMGVKIAARTQGVLRRAFSTYREELGMAPPNKRNSSAEETVMMLAQCALRDYWSRLDSRAGLLYQVAVGEPLAVEDAIPPSLATVWIPTVQEAARSAYQAQAPQGSTRQLRAYSLGWSRLQRGLSSIQLST